ncbi:MAG TPA: glycosyltransferase family 39 protein [Thermoanaerobaculia bacterium]|nr:glycosyltransferase family 39 protein [Thermoanaerobaculia bacterium]
MVASARNSDNPTSLSDSPPSPSSPWAVPLLAALLLASFAIRVWDASPGLNSTRYFDERFAMRNAVAIVKHGDFQPRNAYYLSLSYLPQAAVLAASQGLHRLTGIERLAVFGKGPSGVTPTGYLLCRGLNAAFGTLCLLLIFLIGRRLYSPGVGLLAAAILGAFPKHILASAIFKPDILVVLLTLLTFWWALEAAFRPRLSRFLLAGVGVGLAVSAKYTGIAAAVPVTAAALWEGWRDRRRWGWLVLAGAGSVATFVALNPYLGTVLAFLSRTVHGYAAKGAQEESNHGVVFLRQMEFLAEHHGWIVAVLAALGTAGLLWRIARPAPEDSRERRLGSVLVLSVLVGYSVLHAAGMTLFRSQNYLPVVPFSSLAAAWALVELWRALVRRIPGLRPATVALGFLVGYALVLRQGMVVYPRAVPTNQELAAEILMAHLAPLDLRTVAFEGERGDLPLFTPAGRPRMVSGRLDWLGPAFLDLTDAEVFPATRIGEEEVYGRQAGELRILQIDLLRPFASRGEAVAVRLHPWTLERAFPSAPVRRPLPPELQPGDVVSIALWVPRKGPGLGELAVGDLRLPLTRTAERGKMARLLTPRFLLPKGADRIGVPAGTVVRRWRVEVFRWKPATGAAAALRSPGTAARLRPPR